MTVFCYKTVPPVMRIGEKLKKAREDKGLTLEVLSKQTRIPTKYLTAIEGGAFCSLPKAKSHRVAYLREISGVLQISEQDLLLSQFEKEAGFADAKFTHPRTSIKSFPFASISIFLRNALVIGLVALFAGYLVWQVRGILQPPALTVFSPTEGDIVQNPHTTITGETEKESKLTINGQDVMVDEKGNFSTNVDLSNGVNTVEILATKKHGKTTTITRHIVVQSSPSAKPLGITNY